MDHPENGSQFSGRGFSQNGYAQQYSSTYGTAQHRAQQYAYPDQHTAQQQYHSTAPQIRNPFAPTPSQSAYSNQNADYDPEYEAQVAQWQATYAPASEQLDKSKKGKPENTNFTPLGVRGESSSATANSSTAATAVNGSASSTAVSTAQTDGSNKTVMRKGGGQTWEDSSLLEWDPTQFRIMVGNLAGEVTDESLAKAFAAYDVSKARVVRDKRSTKSKGYGFVSFYDGEKGFKAAREMVGKYIGSHPVTIKRSTTNVNPVAIKPQRSKNDKRKNRDRPDKQQDPLRAHTGAHIEKKPVHNPNGLKLLG